MTPRELQTGTDEVVRRFYNTRAILERMTSSFQLLGPLQALGTILPLNLAAKRRVSTWEARPTSKSNKLHWLDSDAQFNLDVARTHEEG
jgi:hypothetical protein